MDSHDRQETYKLIDRQAWLCNVQVEKHQSALRGLKAAINVNLDGSRMNGDVRDGSFFGFDIV